MFVLIYVFVCSKMYNNNILTQYKSEQNILKVIFLLFRDILK